MAAQRSLFQVPAMPMAIKAFKLLNMIALNSSWCLAVQLSRQLNTPYNAFSSAKGQSKDRLYTVGCNTYQRNFPSFNLSYFIIQEKNKIYLLQPLGVDYIDTSNRRRSRQIMQSPKMFVSPILQFLTSNRILQTADSAVHRLQETYYHIELGIVRKVQVAGAGVFFRIWIVYKIITQEMVAGNVRLTSVSLVICFERRQAGKEIQLNSFKNIACGDLRTRRGKIIRSHRVQRQRAPQPTKNQIRRWHKWCTVASPFFGQMGGMRSQQSKPEPQNGCGYVRRLNQSTQLPYLEPCTT